MYVVIARNNQKLKGKAWTNGGKRRRISEKWKHRSPDYKVLLLVRTNQAIKGKWEIGISSPIKIKGNCFSSLNFIKLMEGKGDCCFSGSLVIIITFISVAIVRFIYVVYQTGKSLHPKSLKPLSTLFVLGSGGHTAEMINVLSALQKNKFMPRFYISAATENMSPEKDRVLEESLVHETSAKFFKIYRSREVGQSYITSIATTLIATDHALWLMIKIRPQVILCNGPGTCVPLCLIAFLFKVLGVRWSTIFYVESIARVRRLSLSGLLLYKLRIADQFYVQWPQLQIKYPRARYVGCLM